MRIQYHAIRHAPTIVLVTPTVTLDSGLSPCRAIARSSLQRRERVASVKKPVILRVVNVGADKVYLILLNSFLSAISLVLSSIFSRKICWFGVSPFYSIIFDDFNLSILAEFSQLHLILVLTL